MNLKSIRLTSIKKKIEEQNKNRVIIENFV